MITDIAPVVPVSAPRPGPVSACSQRDGSQDSPRPSAAGEPTVVPLAGATKVTAAVILEVLAGERSTSSAAALIGVSPVRYYAIESRAIAGLIAACAPRPAGAVPGGGDTELALRGPSPTRTA